MSRRRKRVAISAAAGLIALPFGVVALLAPTAAAEPGEQGKSAEHSQRTEHSQSDQQSPGANGSGNGGGSSQADHSSGNASTTGDSSSPQPASNADFSGNGANTHGPYDSTRDGSPSQNGNGGGQAVGKPCAGCVGKADNKNPKGQLPDGSDPNAGYECDRNHGIGRTNPAHTGCKAAAPPTTQPPTKPPVKPPTKPPAKPPTKVPAKPPAIVARAILAAAPPAVVPPKPVLAAKEGKLAITGIGLELVVVGLAAIGLGGVLVWSSSRTPRLAALKHLK